MTNFFERLDKYMIYKGLNDNKISVECDISNGLIGKARKRGSLSQENISKILFHYSDLDANWLMIGRGEMILKLDVSGENELRLINKRTIENLKEIIIKLQEEVIAIQTGIIKKD